jgi:hemolysin III
MSISRTTNWVEVTPKSIRLRKTVLDPNDRKRAPSGPGWRRGSRSPARRQRDPPPIEQFAGPGAQHRKSPMPLPAAPPIPTPRGIGVDEKIADAAVHTAAIVAGLVAFPVLFHKVTLYGRWGDGLAMGVYATAFFLLFVCSCAYNLAPPSPAKGLLRRFDHAAIFLMIAGTYTALLSQVPASHWAFGLEAFVWVGALAGAAIKLLLPDRFDRVTIFVYLALGWAALPMVVPLVRTLPFEAFTLVVAGGVLYSVGIAFHLWESLRFQTAIWHAFVAAAAGCQFAGVLTAVGR